MSIKPFLPLRLLRVSRFLLAEGHRHGGWLVALTASLLMVTACEETVVTTVAVEEVRVTPEQTQLSIGSTLHLTAELLDRDGKTIRGVPVVWSTDDPSAVEVNADGMVTAVSAGEVLVRATAGGKIGTATIEVVRPAEISLVPDFVALSAAVGSSDRPAAQVAVKNTGDEPLESLEVAVSYPEGEPTGWLAASLSYSAADTLVTLVATPGSLERGTYTATVLVFANESPARIKVTLEMQAADLPSGPSDLVARVEDDAVDLSWSDNSGDESEFRIERRSSNETSFTVLGTVAADVTAYTDATVERDRSYRYRVRACGEGGCSAPSNEASVTMPPLAPSELSAQALSATEIELEWVDRAASEEEFEIQRKTNGSDFSPLTRVGANATSLTDTNLDPGTTYSYRVRACNAGGCSGFADPATATTLDAAVPAAPSELTAEVVVDDDEHQVELTWRDNSTDEIEFRIERRSSNETSFTVLGTVEADVTAYTDASVERDRSYRYRVRACGEGGCSAPSNEASVTMPPLAPSELSAQALSATEIELEWVDRAASEEEFEIQRKTNGSDFSPLTRVGANATSFTDTNLDPATTYSYRVQACNAGGCSEFAGPATATTLDPPAPAAPSDLQAKVVADKLVKLSWRDNSDNEAEFRIYRGESSGSYGQIDSVAADETSYTDEPGEGTYYYMVAACTADGVCAESDEIEVEVPDD